jgi:hypothetical protein
MSERGLRSTIGERAGMSVAERKHAKIDSWVKDYLAKERAAEHLKRQELKALRLAKAS